MAKIVRQQIRNATQGRLIVPKSNASHVKGSVVPSRFSSTSKPTGGSIVRPELNSTSEPKSANGQTSKRPFT